MLSHIGRFEIQAEIGRGGFSQVFRALDPSVGRVVAIKVLTSVNDSDVISRFRTEATAAGNLHHPNIVTIYEFGEHENRPYLVMEYLEGQDLQRILQSQTALTLLQKMDIMSQVAAGLQHAHSHGVLHRDIKPANIMITHDAKVKIMDFGIAVLKRENETQRLTQQGFLIGTVLYMAPELLTGSDVDVLCDVWAYGVLYSELLCGKNPFESASLAQSMYKIVQAEPEALPPGLCPEALQPVLHRMLAKDRDLRYQTLEDVLFDTQPILLGLRQQEAHALLPKAQRLAEGGQWGEALTAIRLILELDPQNTRARTLRERLQSTLQLRSSQDRAATDLLQSATHLDRTSAPECQGSTDPFSLPVPKPSAPGPLPESAEPGEFTRLFQRPPAPAIRKSPLTPPGAESVPDAGEFTQLLRMPREARLGSEELARRQTDELIEFAKQEAFERVVALDGHWLPRVADAEPQLLAFRDAARYLVAATNAANSHNAIDHLARAEGALVDVSKQLLGDDSPLGVELPRAIEVWKQITRARLRGKREEAARQLPNPFRAGQPLRPDQGRSVFRGREDIIRQIETILADAHQSGSIALLGPRRCGKTSLLQMLPDLLPDCLCIFFDLQDNPVDSTQAFFEALDRQVRDQARRDRRMELPALPAGGTFSAAAEWFQALENVLGDFRILICIDEFERLEDLFPGNRQDLLRLMGLFRATIQHRKKLRLLVSGVAPFDELGQIWNDHFINVREIRVGHLDDLAALDLLMRPLPDFPADAIPETVASRVFERTGGQPYLLQLYGMLLIARLNAEGRRRAVEEDITLVEEEAMNQGAPYFRHTYEAAPALARAALEELAAGGRPRIAAPALRWLARRGLVSDDGQLLIPVLGTFMQEELGLAARRTGVGLYWSKLLVAARGLGRKDTQ